VARGGGWGGRAGASEGAAPRQGNFREQALFGLEVFPDGTPGIVGRGGTQARGARGIDQAVGFGAAQRIAARQSARQRENLFLMIQSRVRPQQQAHGVQMTGAAVGQRAQHGQCAFSAALIEQHVGRDGGGGFNEAGLGAGLLLRVGQQTIAPVEFAQAMRGTSSGQGSQHAPRADLGLVQKLGQVFFGVGVAAFKQANPAAFEQFVVASLRALAAPGPDAIGNGEQPGQKPQAHVQDDEGGDDEQDGEGQRHLDAPRPHQKQHVARVRAQDHRKGDGDDGEQQGPEPGTHGFSPGRWS